MTNFESRIANFKTDFESRIAKFMAIANDGDKMILIRCSLIEQGTGLILGHSSGGWYLENDSYDCADLGVCRADLGTNVTAADVMDMAIEWAEDRE